MEETGLSYQSLADEKYVANQIPLFRRLNNLKWQHHLEVGTLLNKASDSIHWWIGDWLNYGMEHFELTYEQAMELLEQRGLSFSYATLRQDKYVAGAIPLSTRVDKLTWHHHFEVAPLPPNQQHYWLSYAEEHKLKPSE